MQKLQVTIWQEVCIWPAFVIGTWKSDDWNKTLTNWLWGKYPRTWKKGSSKVHGQNSEVKCEPIICKENIQEPEVFEEDSFKCLKRLTGSVQEDKKPFKCNLWWQLWAKLSVKSS